MRRLDVAFAQPGPGATLHGGDLVEIRWSSIPPEADEVELLLSLDGGRHFSLRLTEELDAHSRFFLWRVPNLVVDGAALALRMGIRGREVESAAGPLFDLRPEPASFKALLRWKSEELWVVSPEESEGVLGEGSLPVQGLSAQPERLTSLPSWTVAFLSSRTLDPRPLLLARSSSRQSLGDAAAPPAFAFLSHSPRSIPQRI